MNNFGSEVISKDSNVAATCSRVNLSELITLSLHHNLQYVCCTIEYKPADDIVAEVELVSSEPKHRM